MIFSLKKSFYKSLVHPPLASVMGMFGIAFTTVFRQILIFFFATIECGLYFLDRFDVLMSKMIFKK